ncbi:hypothetical protein JHK87_024629 [Glycine soja]|nr:hypothetical protein JHK87_024629 [Glycine soja]
MDFLATVAAYPKPDDKIRSTSLKVSSYSSFTFHEFICVLVLFTLIDGGFSQAVRKNIPILIDAERPKEGLDKLLKLADYVVCSAKFPASWTKASTVPQALVSMLLRLPNIKFVIVTLGKDGCIMLERSVDGPSSEEVDVDSLLESLEIKRDKSVSIPTCIS